MPSSIHLSDEEIRLVVVALREKAQIERRKSEDNIARMSATIIDKGLVSDVPPGWAHNELDERGRIASRMDNLANRLFQMLHL